MNRTPMHGEFARRYGPTALVAGASEGIGRAFAEEIARRGLGLLLVARRQGPLEELAASLRATHGAQVTTAALDLGRDDHLERLVETALRHEVGLLVCNAAASPIGRFLDVGAEEHRQVVAVNCLAPALLCHALGRAMARRGRGGIVLMSSLAGLQGTAMVAHYAATKAYLRVLAEGLENELRPLGVHVTAGLVGPVDTPAFRASGPEPSALVPPPRDPGAIAKGTLDGLGRGPRCFADSGDRMVALVMERLLPRRFAVELMSAVTRRMYGRVRR